jgi:hypothetical protein
MPNYRIFEVTDKFRCLAESSEDVLRILYDAGARVLHKTPDSFEELPSIAVLRRDSFEDEAATGNDLVEKFGWKPGPMGSHRFATERLLVKLDEARAESVARLTKLEAVEAQRDIAVAALQHLKTLNLAEDVAHKLELALNAIKLEERTDGQPACLENP